MKALLLDVKSQLQADLDYIRAGSIFITEDDYSIPDYVKFPAVGLKDGEVIYTIETGDQETDELFVKAIAWVQLMKPEASIVGDDATGQKGVLDIIADIKASLNDEKFSGKYEGAIPVSETESELIVEPEKKTVLQRKSITLRYVRLETE